MSIGGVPSAAANLAGQALPPKGADADRIAHDVANHARTQSAEHRAEAASDVGETSDDVQTNDGDADGRQLLERRSFSQENKDPESTDVPAETASKPPGGAPDPSGELGNELDLRG